MQYVILWPLTVFFTWIGVSFVMFVFSMGQLSALEGAAFQKQYWKWSILSSIYLTIPVIGWLIGFMHVSYSWNKMSNKNAKQTDSKKD